MQIACKAWHCWHTNNYLESLICFVGFDDSLCDRGTNLVFDRLLLIIRGCDEKLILNVHKMLSIGDYINICICNRVLDCVSTRAESAH